MSTYKKRNSQQTAAMRRSAERRQCPECGRKSALSRWCDSFAHVTKCRWCDYESVILRHDR